MLDYCRIGISWFLIALLFVSCQTRPKSDMKSETESHANVFGVPKTNMFVYVRTPSVIYFDPNGQLVDVTDTLEILSFDGATFGWTIPLTQSHPEFMMRENLLQICQNGQKKLLTSSKLVRSGSMVVQNYRDYGAGDCRGMYMYEILFADEVVMTFHLSIM